jgi:hypothetical protein
VRRISYDGGANELQWDGANDAGKLVAAGIYHWVLVLDGNVRRGTIPLLR